ncbi:MAG: DUF255 domain-containing protein [Gemmataceae bacterium]|nr:DUF255 domain-containing protein [Gemmataceae bacterium]
MLGRRVVWIVAFVSGTLQTAPVISQEPIKWRPDYNVARKEAQDKGLPLVLDFGTQSCYWCRKLDETTFRDPKVIGVLNERFVAIKIDAQREPALTSSLRITAFPTLVLAAPDGKILAAIEGYQDAARLYESLHRALAVLSPPEWMERDYKLALQWLQKEEYGQATNALRNIVADGKVRPLQINAQRLLDDLERKATFQLAKARDLQEKGQSEEAYKELAEIVRNFPGLKTSNIAAEQLAKAAQRSEAGNELRTRRAGELLTQARDFFKNREFILCLDRCEVLAASYGDLIEGQEAARIANEVRANTEWLQNAADTLAERLGGLYLALADTHLRRGNHQQGEFYLQRVVQAFPGSRQAETAQIRLGQLQGNLSSNPSPKR